MTGRASSSDDAARTRWCYFSSRPVFRGGSLQCAYRAPRLGISTQGPAKGPRTNHRPVDPDPVHSGDDASVAGFGPDQTPGNRGVEGGFPRLSGSDGAPRTTPANRGTAGEPGNGGLRADAIEFARVEDAVAGRTTSRRNRGDGPALLSERGWLPL